MSALNDLTDKVEAVSDLYAERCHIRRDDDWYLLKLQEELGELVQAHLQLTGRGRIKGQSPDDLLQARSNEAADLLCQFLLYCRHFDIDLDAAVARKWLAYLEPAA